MTRLDLDDHDLYYEEEDQQSDELTEDDREQLRKGAIAVREVLGFDCGIADKQIHDSLWHYYYDVDKTVAYLLNQKNSKKEKKVKGAWSFSSDGCEWACDRQGIHGPGASSFACEPWRLGYLEATKPSKLDPAYWDDMPWLAVPKQRQSTLIAPVRPRGGLLGGSSEAPKMSKLQALAAARKRKALEQSSTSAFSVARPMSGLALGNDADNTYPSLSISIREERSLDPSHNLQATTQVPLKRESSSEHFQATQPISPSSKHSPNSPQITADVVPEVKTARPSNFASTMFHSRSPVAAPLGSLFQLTYTGTGPGNVADAFAGPSPDDVVLAAQSKAATVKNATAKAKGPPKTTGEKKANQITSGVEAIRIDGAPRATSKNLDVLEEYEKTRGKNAASFVVIGHVDAGKSTLMGRLLVDLKVVDERTVDRLRKEAEKMGKSSFALAWVADQGTEERARGVTIDIAMNKFETEKTSFTILDAPGHKDFIPNMIAGASQADFAVLVIDANTGNFEAGLRGQTKEHALLMRSMGCPRLIIAVNKLDTVQWSRERFDDISQQVTAFLLAAGFQEKNISFIPVAGLLGDNIVTRSSAAEAAWYEGPTLLEQLDDSEPILRALDKPLRLAIGDVFRGSLQNPLSVSGLLDAGSIQTGDAVIIQPSGQKAYIKSIERNDKVVDWAVAGQNIILNLSDIDPIHVKAGDVVCTARDAMPCVGEFTAKVLAFEHLIPGGVDVHRGRLNVAGRVAELVATLDKVTGAVVRRRPRVVQPGSVARVRVVLEGREVLLERGQRIILRAGGETVAAGLLEE